MSSTYLAEIDEAVIDPQQSASRSQIIKEGPEAAYYLDRTDRGTPYAITAVHRAADREVVDLTLSNLMREHVTVGLGIAKEIGGDERCYRKNFRTNDIDRFTPKQGHTEAVTLFHTADNQNLSLTPITRRFENLLFDVHSLLRDIDGLHAPDAIDEICKLIFAKKYDEECIKRGELSRFRRYSADIADACAADVRSLLGEASNVSINAVSGHNSYRTDFHLSNNAIFKAVEALEQYDLSGTDLDVLGRAFQKVLTPAIRAGMGQYFTPQEVIDFIVEIMQPQIGERILDPFCGPAHFLTRAIQGMADQLSVPTSSNWVECLYGIEKSDRMARIAITDMRVFGQRTANILCHDALSPFEAFENLEPASFDLIMTNPPFGVDLPAQMFGDVGPFELTKGIKTQVSLDVLAIERCVNFLKPGGRMAIVLPEGILGNRSARSTREWILSNCQLKAVVSLPVSTFSPFGANVKTSIVVIRKLQIGEIPSPDSSVFLAEAQGVGFDASGKGTGENELPAIAAEFVNFIHKGHW